MVLQLGFVGVQVFEPTPGTFQVVCPRAGITPNRIKTDSKANIAGITCFSIFTFIFGPPSRWFLETTVYTMAEKCGEERFFISLTAFSEHRSIKICDLWFCLLYLQ